MLLSVFLISTLFIVALYGLTLAYYMLLKPVESSKKAERELPFVSVLVPARNEETKIARCIESLLAQDYPNFELVVIDDRSTDSTGDIIQAIAERDNRLKFVRGKDAPAAGLANAMLAHALATPRHFY
jgi:cellulose synthase/poly-beta-1,6-N-acetylglucosamine synthase-like glycosyltransferase